MLFLFCLVFLFQILKHIRIVEFPQRNSQSLCNLFNITDTWIFTFAADNALYRRRRHSRIIDELVFRHIPLHTKFPDSFSGGFTHSHQHQLLLILKSISFIRKRRKILSICCGFCQILSQITYPVFGQYWL